MPDEKLLFVISPIGEEGSDVRQRANRVYEEIIKPAAKESNYKAIRIDQVFHPGDIPALIVKHLLQDHLAVADLTGQNPNVFYELGARHAFRKPVIHIISSEDKKLPFDVSGFKTIFYELTDVGIEKSRNDLVQTITYAEKNPDALETSLSLAVENLAVQQIRSDIKDIRNSMSTRYIGRMITYYERVIDLIKSAEDTIDILCDYPAYGCFTDPRHWSAYSRVLQDIKRRGKVSISLTCPDQKHRDENDKKNYFPRAWNKSTWDEWKQECGDEIELFLKFAGYENQSVDELARAAFFKIFWALDRSTLKDCFGKTNFHETVEVHNKVEIREVNGIPPLDFWVIDKTKAIFAFSNYARGSSRYGFSTEHEKLISAFGEIRDSYRHKRA
jgi:hypothetical protein